MHWEDPEGLGGEGGGRGDRDGNTCKSMADSFQCMTKPTTIKKKVIILWWAWSGLCSKCLQCMNSQPLWEGWYHHYSHLFRVGNKVTEPKKVKEWGIQIPQRALLAHWLPGCLSVSHPFNLRKVTARDEGYTWGPSASQVWKHVFPFFFSLSCSLFWHRFLFTQSNV